ncbi:MAG: hypothetical protein V1847_02545 [Candidatus Diapherotrites archaeon]
MNESGNVIVFILLGFAAILVLPPLILYLFPAADILFRIIAIFVIFSTVRGYIGDGAITYIISAILIYFLVFKYSSIFASVYVFQMLLSVSFTSVLVWGIGTRMR